MSVSLRRGRFAVFPVLAAVLTALFTVTPAHAASGTITGLAGKCADVAGASTANGTAVQLYDCNGTGAQIWSSPGDGTLRALGKCLDIADRSTGDGAAVQLWDCSGGANQQWVVSAARDIVNPAANKCLDVRDNNSANGTRLQGRATRSGTRPRAEAAVHRPDSSSPRRSSTRCSRTGTPSTRTAAWSRL